MLNGLNKNYWLFRCSQVIALVSEQIVYITITFYILSISNTATNLAKVLVPANIVGLFATLVLGAWGDKLQRKTLMLYGNCLKAGVWLCIATLCWHNALNLNSLRFLYALSVIACSIIGAGSVGFLPEIVAKETLPQGVCLNFAIDAVGKIIAGATGGALIILLGTKVTFNLTVVNFVVVIFILLLIKPQYTASRSHITIKKLIATWKQCFTIGLKYIHKTKELRYLLGAIFFLQIVIAPLPIILPAFIKKQLLANTNFLGWALSSEGVGAVLAMLMISSITLRIQLQRMLFGLLGFASLALVMLSYFTSKIILLLLLIIFSFALTAVIAVVNIYLLRRIPEILRSRFFSFAYFLEGSAMSLGGIMAGYMLSHFSIQHIFMLMGISLIGIAVIAFRCGAFGFIYLI